MRLESTAFEPGGTIPARYTCDGDNLSPPLSWREVPEGAKSLALIVDDPDAPAKVWVHWVAYDLPPDSTGLEEGARAAAEGANDFGERGYGGPCPPSGTHRYDFKLYALDTELGLAPGASKQEVLKAMQGHVLAETQLEGRYARRGR